MSKVKHSLKSAKSTIADLAEIAERRNLKLEIDERKTIITRDQLIEILHSENILARRYFYPGCHRMEPYRSLYPKANLFLPQTERVAERVLTLPTGQAIGPEFIRVVCNVIRTVLENACQIRELLEKNHLPAS